jgi:hypothetical protein
MIMEDLSTFCSLPQSLSSEICSSPCRVHSHPLSGVLLCIWFFFEGIVNVIDSIYSFSICSLLVYRKCNDHCKLIFLSTTLLKLFMVSGSFWVEFFEYLMYRITSSQIVIIWQFIYLFLFLLFLLILLLWLGIPGLCGTEVGIVGTFLLFLMLGEMVSVFLQ